MRVRDYNDMSEVFAAWGRELEIVPAHQTVAEMLWWPVVQHRVARWMVYWRGARWKKVRFDRPWPVWCPWDEEVILGREKRERRWRRGKAVEEEGRAGVKEKEGQGWWAYWKTLWPFS